MQHGSGARRERKSSISKYFKAMKPKVVAPSVDIYHDVSQIFIDRIQASEQRLGTQLTVTAICQRIVWTTSTMVYDI